MTFAVVVNMPITGKRIAVRALPSRRVAEKVATEINGKAIVDPRSVQR